MGTFGRFLKSAGLFLDKHRPEILTGVGIGGMIGTVVLAVRETPKAVLLLEERKKEENVEKLTPLQTIETAWKCYIPSALTGALSITCIIGGSVIGYRRTAALAAACTIAENSLQTYQQKVIETIGEKKEVAIRDDICKEELVKNPVIEKEVVLTGCGNSLFYDPMSGRYFRSDIEHIKKAVNELNRHMIADMYVSLNEFYDEIGLTHNEVGDILGWNVNRGLIEIHFSAQIAEDEKTPCLVLNHEIAPMYNYQYV